MATEVDHLSLVNLMELEVVAPSLSEQSAASAAAVVDVITAEQIQRAGYQSVGEALGSLPGLDLPYDHYQYNLGVRGVSPGKQGWSRSVKVMINGQPVAFRPSGETFLGPELIPMTLIDRIEVVRGPVSALYGPNAFLGVVNVVTKSPLLVDGGNVTGGLETGPRLSRPFGEVMGGTQTGPWSLLLAGGGESQASQGYRVVPLPGGDASEELSSSEASPSGSVYGEVGYAFDESAKVSLDGHFQQLERAAEMMDWGPVTHGNYLSLNNGYGRLRLDKTWEKNLHLSATVALSSSHPTQRNRLTVSDSDQYVTRSVSTFGADFRGSLNYTWKRTSVLGGADFTRDNQELQNYYTVDASGVSVLNPPAGTPTGHLIFSNAGAFLQVMTSPLAFAGRALVPLGATLGVRYDSHNLYGEVLNGRIGVVYASPRAYVKVLAGTSFRAPSSTQLYSNAIANEGTVGNPELRPERATTLELALGGNVVPELMVRANVYLTTIEDRVEIRAGGVETARSNDAPVNSTPIEALGLAAQVDYRTRRLRAYLNYSLQRAGYEVEDELTAASENVRVETDAYPDHMFRLGLTWLVPAAFLQVTSELRFTGRRLGFLRNNADVNGVDYLTVRYQLDPYALLDLTISTLGIEFLPGRETRFATKIRNLLGAEYAVPGYNGFDVPGLAPSVSFWAQQEL